MPRFILLTLIVLTAPFTALAGPYDVPSPIPDTGQTKCWDTDGNEIDCAGTGQDGEYSINPMSYTKLDSEGNELPDSAESWTMVRDNVTGLIWEVKTNKDNVENYDDPHDADNTYTWYDPDPVTNGGDAGTESDHDTVDFIEVLNSVKYGGYSDWRLPSREELRSIVVHSIPSPGPTIDSNYFPSNIGDQYWVSTPYFANAWYINFDIAGDAICSDKSIARYVRAVRGGRSTPTSRFQENNDGTITDIHTGLIWEKKTDDDGLNDKDNEYTWQEALEYCNSLNLSGETDWRLPTIKELAALADISRFHPAIAPEFEDYTAPSFYWSSTSRIDNKYNAYKISFSSGGDITWHKSEKWHVRAVRGGQSGSLNHLVIAEPIRFTPFHPTTDTTPSPIMQGGKAVRYYRILSPMDDAPLANRVLCYRFSKDGDPIADFTGRVDVDDQGFVGIHTPPALSSGRYDLIVTDDAFNPLSVDIIDAPSFQVSVSPRRFSESYSCLLGGGVTVGVGGPGVKLGPVEFKTVKAGLTGQQNLSTRFVLDNNGYRTDLEVVNTSVLGGGVEGFAGISGSIFKEYIDENGRPKLEAGVEGDAIVSNAMTTRHRFENYTDSGRPDADRQLFALSCLFFENLIRTNPSLRNNILVKKLLEILIESISHSDDYFETVGSESAVKTHGSLGAELSFKNPIGVFAGSSGGVSLNAFENEFVYARTEEEDAEGYGRSTQAVTTSLEIGSFTAGIQQKFAGDKRRKDTPRFDLDLINGALVKMEGEKSLSFSNGPNNNEMVFKTLINREGDQLFFIATDMHERHLEMVATDDAAITSIAARSDLARQMYHGDNLEISPVAYTGLFDAFLDIDSGTETWRVMERDLTLISAPIDFGLSLGLSVGLNFEVELESAETYETRKGLIVPGGGMFATELYEKDDLIGGNIKGFSAVVNPFKEKIVGVLDSTLATLEETIGVERLFIELPTQGIAWLSAEAGTLVEGAKVRFSRLLNGDRRSYIIVVGGRSTDETTTAATVGNVVIVSVEKPDGALMTEFSTPLDLTIGYTETDLAASGYTPADADRLNIYHWHSEDHYYEFVGGTLDADNLQMSTPIHLPGQYALAIDAGAPRIVDFNISGGTAAPLISFSVQDELSGLNPAAFAVSLDNETVVDAANYADYLEMPTGVFAWRPKTPLAEGIHQLAVAVQDTTGNSETYTFDFTVDATPPVVDHAPITTANAGAPLTVQASVSDNNEMAGVALFYRPKIHESPYRSVEMTADGANQYAAAIPAGNLIGAGTQYFIKAVDAAGNETATDPTDIAVADATGPTLKGDIAVKLTTDGLKLTWTPAPDADTAGYRIYAGPSPDALELQEEMGAFSYATLPVSLTGAYIAVAPFDAAGNEGQRSTPVQLNPCFPGDVDCSNEIDLADAIDAFKILTGIALNVPPAQIADLDGDSAIGLAEAINALQHTAGLK